MPPFFAGSVLQAFHISAIGVIARSCKTKNIPPSRCIIEYHLLPHASKRVPISPISRDAR